MKTPEFEKKLKEKNVDIAKMVFDNNEVSAAYGYVDGNLYKWDGAGKCTRAYPRTQFPELDIVL